MKKQNYFALTAILLFASITTIVATKNSAFKAFGESTSNWKHFSAVEATYSKQVGMVSLLHGICQIGPCAVLEQAVFA